jgi:hypothetical protein
MFPRNITAVTKSKTKFGRGGENLPVGDEVGRGSRLIWWGHFFGQWDDTRLVFKPIPLLTAILKFAGMHLIYCATKIH